MMDVLVTIGYVVICVLLFSLAIAIHEFGHFIAALKLGLSVKCFSIGFGPAIWKKTWRGVEYRLSCIPLGGYVSIPDVDPEGTKVLEAGTGDQAKRKIPAWKELVVAFAGPAMNLVLALVVALVLAAVPSARFGRLPAVVASTLPGGPAERAGIQPGDTVVAVNGKPVADWTEMRVELQIAGATEIDFQVRNSAGEERTVKVTPELEPVSGMCIIKAEHLASGEGCSWMPDRNPLQQLWWDAGSVLRVLKGLVTPKEMKNTAKALGGPQMIAEGIYRAIRSNVWDGLGFFRFLNVNLAVLNLLPIPVLDGGIILFTLIALVFRRRVPAVIVEKASLVFMVLLLGLMGLLIFRDAQRSWRVHQAVNRIENVQTNANESAESR